MFHGTVTNERQRQKFEHEEGPLQFGRHVHQDVPCVVIDDDHVSRDQFRISQIGDELLHVENRGRSTIYFGDGSSLNTLETAERKIPFQMTVGRTVVEISPERSSMHRRGGSRTLDTDRYQDVLFLALGHDFPYPLATGYRQLSDFVHESGRYKELLRLSENLLAFLGSLSLALLDKPRLLALNEQMPSLVRDSFKGGISPGNWLDLAIHAGSILEDMEDMPLAKRFARLNLAKEKLDPGRGIRKLIQAKNDFKHDRGPASEIEFKNSCTVICVILSEVFDRLRFLKSHNLVLVQDVNPQRRGNMADVEFLKCMGNNPGFPSDLRVLSPTLHRDDLYYELDDSEFVPLYPFLHARTCSRCGKREFYFIDRLDCSGSQWVASLKSFDRGHTETDAEVGMELQSLFDDQDTIED